MNIVDATCADCGTAIRWSPLAPRLCVSCLVERRTHRLVARRHALPARRSLRQLTPRSRVALIGAAEPMKLIA